ncbi:MAG: N-acetyl-gamma-glutamyl-phosphate reductase [Acidimicrobiales bacterium]|nr:MAG: N-acetyl-gamma-glutamyl-phosphate reductase [Acidimicrobiales bacterium]
MGIRAAIAGASGYVGGELARLLSTHPDVTLATLTASRGAGTAVSVIHPHLQHLNNQVFAETTPDALADHDVVFLALPHGHAAALADALPPTLVVIDCGADHRLIDSHAWQRWYGGPHAGAWPYGLPELPDHRTALFDARRVAVPGCYASAAALAIAPALVAGLAEPDVVVVAASGTSGAGKEPRQHLTSAEVIGSMSAYGVGGAHRHTPEITQSLSSVAHQPVRVSFTPMLAPMTRGILATVSALARPGLGAAQLREAYASCYDSEPFVALLPENTWPSTGATIGANTAHVQVALDSDAERVVAVAAMDNLVKGSAGAAVQCMNLALGLPETRGLPFVGVAP